MPVDDAGLASGLFNTSQQIGGALGLALLSTFAANKTADVLASTGGKPTDAETAQALVDGFHVAWIGCAVFLAAGAVLLFALLRRGDVLAVAARRASAGRHVGASGGCGVKIAPFRIEQYYAVHEFTAPHMLSSSDAESVAIADLLALEPDAADRLLALAARLHGVARSTRAARCGVGDLRDDLARRRRRRRLRPRKGIFAAYHALLEPGDHVVVETPCYESALQVAARPAPR